MNKIVTYYDAMDELWFAYRETGQDDQEETPYGYGLTEEEAIKYLEELNLGKD